MVPFAGWSMPIQYVGVIEEHLCVRQKLGLFDVSHMGEIDVAGKEAFQFLQKLITNDLSKMTDGSILYTLMCRRDGGVVDDLLVHRFNAEHYFLCVNASNADRDFQWAFQNAEDFDVEVRNTSEETAQLALQGRSAEALLQKLTDASLADMTYYHFIEARVCDTPCVVSRTGYTGEDGFEIYFNPERAEPVYRALLDKGREFGLQPIGLGARDTLRMEMGYALYGNEITQDSSPLERGLGWVIKLDGDDFIGRDALREQKEKGLEYQFAGVKLLERGVPRSHYRILDGEEPIGELTSGTFSPTLNVGIGLGFLRKDKAQPGSRVSIEIRNQQVSAEVVKPPFVPSGVKR